MKFILCGLLTLMVATTSFARLYPDKNPAALKNTVILIIRHAEKPDDGFDLSPAGQERAKLYVNYFKNYSIDSTPLKIDCIFAAADSKDSHRPRLTIEPFSKAAGLPIDDRFKDKDFQELADEILSKPHGQAILISWHHEEIPQLIQALGANPNQFFTNAKWPADVFGWVIQLRYDAVGHLIEAKRINENLMPDDSDKHTLKP
jgi:hypothetical protein